MCDKSKLLCNFAQIFKEIVMRKRFIHILWAVFGTGILTVILAFVAIWFGMIGYMPDIEDLQNPINRFATQVYSADGKSTDLPPRFTLPMARCLVRGT